MGSRKIRMVGVIVEGEVEMGGQEVVVQGVEVLIVMAVHGKRKEAVRKVALVAVQVEVIKIRSKSITEKINLRY